MTTAAMLILSALAAVAVPFWRPALVVVAITALGSYVTLWCIDCPPTKRRTLDQ